MVDFPDRHHVEHIRTALWRGREFGQAAVMIGAGFSRNATRAKQVAHEMPLWSDLASAMRTRLNHTIPSSRMSDPLMLAQEYELTFGRSELDRLIRDATPDDDWRPGKLHNLLLTLPWADVFTTNYDTLLERAAQQIIERRYDIVLHHDDIPGAARPRIIKLHGSFRSNRPFIITQNDFLTYPRVFAPFVNTVQQSIMENVLILIGFSGVDPNFLAWTGWVRDNLARSARKIYLCDLRTPSPAESAMFNERNIVPIDLSCVVSNADSAGRMNKYAIAIEWLLLSLANGARPNVMDWPQYSLPFAPQPSPGVPPPLPCPHTLTSVERPSP